MRLPAGAVVVTTLIALSAVGGGLLWLHKVSYDAGVAAATQQIERERADRTREINRLTRLYLDERRVRLDLEARLDAEAADDPDAANRAIGADSVRRLNTVR